MGIDYGRIGQSNRNVKTGIHYGIVPARSLHEFIYDDMEPVYAFHCPHCGNEQKDNGNDNRRCSKCYKKYQRDDAWGEDPVLNGITRNEAGLWSAWMDDSNDCWFTDSKYVYHANFASPCAPGAGYFREAAPEGHELDCLAYGPDPDMWPDEVQGHLKLTERPDGLILVEMTC